MMMISIIIITIITIIITIFMMMMIIIIITIIIFTIIMMMIIIIVMMDASTTDQMMAPHHVHWEANSAKRTRRKNCRASIRGGWLQPSGRKQAFFLWSLEMGLSQMSQNRDGKNLTIQNKELII